MAALDVNKDGFPDLLLANNYISGAVAGSVTVLINQPIPTVTGTLTASPEPSTVQQPFRVIATLSPPAGSSQTALSGTVAFYIDGTPTGATPVANNTATFNLTTQVARGKHTLAATWSGDNNYPTLSLTGSHTVIGYPVSLSFTSSANPVVFGQGFTTQYRLSNAASVPAGIPQPSGTFSLSDNGTNLFPPTTVTNGISGSAAFTLGLTPAGRHTLVASYSGDSIHEAASATIVENITPISSATTVQTSPNPSVYGQYVTVSANVTILTGNSLGRLLTPPSPTITFTGLPGGSVTTFVGVNPSLSTSTTTVLIATYRTNTLPAGTYNVSASYSGNVNSQPSTSLPIAHIVQAAPTTTTLTATPASAYQHQAIVLSVRVNGALAAPTGSVQFFDGSTPLSTVALASGAASLSTSQLTQGPIASPPSIAATPAISAQAHPLSLSPFFPRTSPSPSARRPSPSSPATTPRSISPLPAWATSTTPFVSTPPIFPNGSQFNLSHLNSSSPQVAPPRFPSTSTRTLSSATWARRPRAHHTPHESRQRPQPSRSSSPITLRRRRRIASLLALILAAALLAAASGCSGKYPDSTLPGVYTLKITATGAQSGLTHTINLPLTITQ